MVTLQGRAAKLQRFIILTLDYASLSPFLGRITQRICFPTAHILVGEFNPSEKYARQIGSFPQMVIF